MKTNLVPDYGVFIEAEMELIVQYQSCQIVSVRDRDEYRHSIRLQLVDTL
jgi:hypothetical protein